MTLAELGEFGFIDRIARRARRQTRRGVVLGIGDDAAVLRPRRGEDVVVSTDCAFEDVHFRWRSHAPRVVGARALAAALSDLAAMGARPLGCTLALTAPGSLAVATADALVAGVLRGAREHACPLVGGNLSRARETSLTLTVVGAVARGRALTRAGARPGDRVCVTGALGAGALELERARRAGGRVRRVPVPRLRAGRALARCRGVGGCIDVSDGLEADLGHLLAGSGAEAELEWERVPRPRGFDAACGRAGLDPRALALRGGEDFELLFTLRPSAPGAAALGRRLGLPVSEIGRLVAARRGRRPAGRAASPEGFRHF